MFPVDWEDCGFAGGGGASSISHGLLVTFEGEGFSSAFPKLIPAVGLIGVRDREVGNVPFSLGTGVGACPSPRRTKVSIDFSKFPFNPFSTAIFRFSSLNPISRSFAILLSKSSWVSLLTEVVRKILEGFLGGGEGDRLCCDSC